MLDNEVILIFDKKVESLKVTRSVNNAPISVSVDYLLSTVDIIAFIPESLGLFIVAIYLIVSLISNYSCEKN